MISISKTPERGFFYRINNTKTKGIQNEKDFIIEEFVQAPVENSKGTLKPKVAINPSTSEDNDMQWKHFLDEAWS